MDGMVGAKGGAQWPDLREELRLYPGPAGLYGEPSWTLYDPAAQRFFRLGWLEIEIFTRWGLGSPEAIAAAVGRETTLAPHPAMVDSVKTFLVANDLVRASGPADTGRLAERRNKKPSLLLTAVKNYLFIRIPLVRPEAFLSRTVRVANRVFTRRAALLLGFFAVMALYLVSRQWAEFRDSFAPLISFEGGLMAALAIGFSKILHELGHAYAAKSLGLRVPSMGLSLMCFAPVLWTDTTEAWKLTDRRQRLFIGAAGVYAELFLAVFAALAWLVLPPGALKTTAFITASSTWILTLTVNLNPCMRYDGYYLLSDYWNVPGLQTRSFALARWWLRERLFGLGLPAPETFSVPDRGKLIAYAFVTWIYRLFLFLGIALLVYHLFFKALGVVLMAVELVFFIALPIVKEVLQWARMRDKLTRNPATMRSALLLAALLGFCILPWHSRVQGPSMLFAERQALFFAPAGAMVDHVGAANGETVAEGDVVFQLRSPDLEREIDLAARKVSAQRLKLSFASLDTALRAEMATDWQELERLAENLGGMLARRDEMAMRAPFPGTVHDIPAWTATGSWVAAKEGLGILTGGGSLVAVYVSESDWNRITPGGTGKFYAAGPGWDTAELTVIRKDAQAVTELAYPELASVLGGPLPVHKDAQGRLKPEQAVYRVLCRVDGAPGNQRPFLVGNASLKGETRSLAAMVWNNFMGLLVRESGW